MCGVAGTGVQRQSAAWHGDVDNVHHTWTLTTTLAPGAYNQLNATAIDEAGNPANTTTTQTVQVNDAPVLTPISPTLTTITEDQTTNAAGADGRVVHGREHERRGPRGG